MAEDAYSNHYCSSAGLEHPAHLSKQSTRVLDILNDHVQSEKIEGGGSQRQRPLARFVVPATNTPSTAGAESPLPSASQYQKSAHLAAYDAPIVQAAYGTLAGLSDPFPE